MEIALQSLQFILHILIKLFKLKVSFLFHVNLPEKKAFVLSIVTNMLRSFEVLADLYNVQ